MIRLKLIKYFHNIKIYNTLILCVSIVLFSLIFIGCKKDMKSNKVKLNIENPIEVKNNNVKNITIFVHGTHFSELLTKALKPVLFVPKKLTKASELDKNCYVKWFIDKASFADPIQFPIDYFYAIGWSGILSSQERLKAAQNLYNELIILTDDLRSNQIEPRITIIGHSHGGNVALNLAKVNNQNIEKLGMDEIQTHPASRVDFAPAKTVSRDNLINFKINKLVLLATPVQEETEKFIENDIFNKVYSLYSKADMIQVLDPQGLQNAKSSFFSHRRFKHHEKLKQAKVKINNRAILHEEFIFYNFPKILPELLDFMDKCIFDDREHLIKVEYKKNKIINIEVK